MQTTLEPMQFTIEQLETTAQAEFANRSMLEYSIIWNKLNILELLLPYSQVTDQMIKSMVRHGNAKTISLILASHPYLLTTTFNSKSLLDEAIERSSIDTALFLYQNNCIPTDTTLFTLAKKVMGHKPDSKYFELFRAIAVHPMTTINKRDEWDRTVLDILLRRSQNPHRHSLQHLVLKLGLDIDKPSAGLTPIQVSILQGDVETIRVLLQYGPKIKPTAFFESIEEMCPGKRKEEMIEVLRGKSVPPLTYLCLRHGIPDYWRLRINPFE
jgi:ankyrin repeat protein